VRNISYSTDVTHTASQAQKGNHGGIAPTIQHNSHNVGAIPRGCPFVEKNEPKSGNESA